MAVNNKTMISVTEAKQKIDEKVGLLHPAILPLQEVAGLMLAEDVYSKFDIPSFDQSSMDGYAIRFLEKDFPLEIANSIAAGDGKFYKINSKQTARIFTGAPLPQGADTVVTQEKVTIENKKLIVKDIDLKKGNNVRERGIEIKKGKLALSANTLLTPASIGYLASFGIAEVLVFPAPKACIIITGNELQMPGKPISNGQVYDSNSFSLSGALRECGIHNIDILYANDQADMVVSTLKKALKKNDIILLTGGISVGDFDFVLEATEKCGVIKHFHKIKQKPGKPLYFGTLQNKVIFGLPGNPGSALTCFYEYVLPAIKKMMNQKNSIQKIKAFLQSDYSKNPGMKHFLKGFYENGKATVLPSQASFQLSSFALANCLIVVDEEKEIVKKGEEIEVHVFGKY